MFVISLSFPYEYQMKKVFPNLVSQFLERVEKLAFEHATSQIIHRDSHFYFFDEEKVSPVFFPMKFLYSLYLLIGQVSDKINEYKIIIEYFLKDGKREEVIENLLKIQNLVFDYNKVIIGSKASRYIKNYVSYSSVNFSSLNLLDKFVFFENTDQKLGDIDFKAEIPAIFLRTAQNYLVSLYNFFSMYPLSEADIGFFSEIEKKTFFETKAVLNFFSKNRFKEKMPKYFVDAFIIYAQLQIKNFKISNSIEKIDIYVDSLDKKLGLELEKLKQILGDVTICESGQTSFELDAIPDDLLEIIYLLLYASKFLLFDEFTSFFFATTKTYFYQEILSIMYKYKIITQKDIIYSYQDVALKAIEKKLKSKRSKISSTIAKFLWSKYENSEIAVDLALKKVFDILKFEYKEIFVEDIFFNEASYYSFILLTKPHDCDFFENIELLKKYKLALELEKKGDDDLALNITKELNVYFHNNAVSSGEYRSLSLLAFLHLRNNNINDALTYYIYAAEMAKKTKNSSFICESLYFLSVVYFLQRDFKNTLSSLQELSSFIAISFSQEWKIFCLFMQGRVYLELGEISKASVFFKLARDFANLYFPHLQNSCNAWYARSCIYEGKIDVGQKILSKETGRLPILFLLESYILFPTILTEKLSKGVVGLYQKYHDIITKCEYNMHDFSCVEDICWYKTYKKSCIEVLFDNFFSYYIIMFNHEVAKEEKERYLSKLSNVAMESLYARDTNASLYLYLCYEAQCKMDRDCTGTALGFLSKACKVMQSASSFMYETSIRDKFMKKNVWNAKLFKVASENKLI